MYFLINFFIWIRKNLIRIILNEYPNVFLNFNKNNLNTRNKINLITSTDNYWVSKEMYKKWASYFNTKEINLDVYSNKNINKFMFDNFKTKLIYEIYKKSQIPVQKIDIFRICYAFKNGGIWLDLKSEICIRKTLDLILKPENKNGLLMYEPRKIDVIKKKGQENYISTEFVIHNGFFYLPKDSFFINEILNNIEEDYLYFQDVLLSEPKQGMMNLTGPHQFTRSFHKLNSNNQPTLVSQEEISWKYMSKHGEYISPIHPTRHYSSIKNKKIVDSRNLIELKT